MQDLYNIAVDHSRYATALPPPLNVIGLLWQLSTFSWRYKKIAKHWPKANVIRRLELYLQRNSDKFPYREFHTLEECHPDDENTEEIRTDREKAEQMKINMFMENARKDYLSAVNERGVKRVENKLTHMHETVVQMLEAKIESKIQRIQDKLEQCFPAEKDLAANEGGSNHEEIVMCGYLADVEGNFDYFERYLAISQIIGWAHRVDGQKTVVDKTKLRFKRSDAMFVYGGDTQDKGIGDIRFTKLLLALKKDYPDRVEFIIGNRDANKLRFATELHADAISDPLVLNDPNFPYWDNNAAKNTPQKCLDMGNGTNKKNTAANRLRWILDKTMGSAGAFGRRREELSIIRGCTQNDVNDDDIVESYRQEVDPHTPFLKWEEDVDDGHKPQERTIKNEALADALQDKREFTLDEFANFKVSPGSLSEDSRFFIQAQEIYVRPAVSKKDDNFMLQFLKEGKLAYIFGSNLFLHGAINTKNMGTIPEAESPVDRVDEWVHALNAWTKLQVAAFEKDPYHHSKNGETARSGEDDAGLYRNRNGHGLMDYGVPNGEANTTYFLLST